MPAVGSVRKRRLARERAALKADEARAADREDDAVPGAQLAELIVDIATGEAEDHVDDGRNAAAAALGRKGGKAQAKKLTPAKRRAIAQKAAKARRRSTE
jgi:hypothetical protein